MIGQPEDRWVVASTAGYGFVVKLGDLMTRNKAGKVALRVPAGASVVAAACVGGIVAAEAERNEDRNRQQGQGGDVGEESFVVD